MDDAQQERYSQDVKKIALRERDQSRLVDAYLDSRRQERERLPEALAAGDFESIQSIGHNLKGTGSTFGFEGLSEIGTALEAAAERRDPSGIRVAIAELTDFLERVVWRTTGSIRRSVPRDSE